MCSSDLAAVFEDSTNDCDYRLLANLFGLLLDEVGGLTVETDESEALELVLRHNPEKKYYTFSLLNYQELRRPIPLTNVQFLFRSDVAVRDLYSVRGASVSYEKKEDGFHFTLEKLEHFDVIYLHYD